MGDSVNTSGNGGISRNLSILTNDKEGVSIFSLSHDFKEATKPVASVPASSAQFSLDGKLLAVIHCGEVKILKSETGELVTSVAVPSVVAVSFSPKNTYIQAFRKPNAEEKNLVLFRVETGESVLEQHQKVFIKANWPSIQFSDDETLACRCMTNEVQLYDTSKWSAGISQRLRVSNLAGAQLAFDPPTHLATFIRESKGAPAGVRIFPLPVKPDAQPCARRSFFKANSCKIEWNRGSTAVLALSQADVDKTNKSYYGESNLHFLAVDASFEGSVPLGKEGPIHDVQWSPSGKEFCVVYGFMPAKATLFNSRCKPVFEFGSAAWNMVRWNPHGRYLCLGGFGNLPGDIEIWDRPSLTKLGATRASNGVTLEWSPQGLHLLVATTAPRLQVDNGIRVYACDATMVYQKAYSALFSAEFKPASRGTFPDFAFAQGSAKPAVPALSSSSAAAGVKKPAGAYRPPNARFGGTAGSSLKAQLSGSADQPRSIGATPAGLAGGESKSAAKNRKKREKEKKSSESAVQVGEKAPQLAVAPQQAEIHVQPAAGDASVDASKKLRAIQKKLRQIEEVKKKQSEGAELTAEQAEKVAQENGLRQEAAALEKEL